MEVVTEEVPPLQAVRIEYPGFISNLNKAIDSLGGQPGLEKAAASSNNILPLKLRPKSATAHPIFGERYSLRGLLIKVRRKKGESGEAALEAGIVARIVGSYRFSGLADFHVAPDESLKRTSAPHAKESQQFQEESGERDEPVLALPPLFTRNDEPIDYEFRPYYGEDPPTFRTAGQGQLKGHLPAHVVQWIAHQVPKAIDYVTSSFKPEKAVVLTGLKAAFSERLIWSSLAIREKVPNIGPQENEKELLSKVAYMFRTGPFKGLWIKRAYDPRLDPSSRKFQGIFYQLPSTWAEKVKRRPEDHDDDLEEPPKEEKPSFLPPITDTYSQLCKFAAVPKQTAHLQVCDLQDLHISTITHDSTSTQPSCSKATGWFSTSDWESIEKRMNFRFKSLLKNPDDPEDGIGESSTVTSNLDPKSTDLRRVENPAESGPAPNQSHSDAQASQGGMEELQGKDTKKGGIVPDDLMNDFMANWPAKEMDTGDAKEGEEEEDLAGNQDEEFEIFEEESEADDEDMVDAGDGPDDEMEDNIVGSTWQDDGNE